MLQLAGGHRKAHSSVFAGHDVAAVSSKNSAKNVQRSKSKTRKSKLEVMHESRNNKVQVGRKSMYFENAQVEAARGSP